MKCDYDSDLFAIQLCRRYNDAAAAVDVEHSQRVGRHLIDDSAERRIIGVYGDHGTDVAARRQVLRHVELVVADSEDRRVVVDVSDDKTKCRRTAESHRTSGVGDRHHVVDGQKNIK